VESDVQEKQLPLQTFNPEYIRLPRRSNHPYQHATQDVPEKTSLQTHKPGYIRGEIRCLGGTIIPLDTQDIPEQKSLQTCNTGYTRGEIRCLGGASVPTNTKPQDIPEMKWHK
jgi:hypothetical protein